MLHLSMDLLFDLLVMNASVLALIQGAVVHQIVVPFSLLTALTSLLLKALRKESCGSHGSFLGRRVGAVS